MIRNGPKLPLADLIRVLHALEPDEKAMPTIAAMLGLKPNLETIILPAEADIPEDKPEHTNILNQNGPGPILPELSGEVIINLKVEVVEEEIQDNITELILPEPLEVQAEEQEVLPEFYPLLSPKWTRAIITKILAIHVPDGNPDIARLISDLAAKKPLKQIPLQSVPTLRQGVQLLIDEGAGMVPYRRDQVALLQQIIHIVGNDRVEAWTFKGTPLKHATPITHALSAAYALPDRSKPVLMLTDVGISSPPYETEVTSTEEWLTFVQQVQQAGHPLFALVPYAPIRWPDQLKNRLNMIEWDYTTSVLTILQTVS